MKLTIITITFNSEKTIEDTILSIVKQEIKGLEYIIVDGGSVDGTLKIINKYSKYVSTLISEPDQGISDAFNKGINMATGDIIGIINSDDFLQRDALKKLINTVDNNPKFDIYYGNSIMLSSKGAFVYRPGADLSLLPLYMILSHPATFIKRETYIKYGAYNLSYECAMDFELISKMYCHGAKFMYIDTVLTCFRLGGTSKKKSYVTKKESLSVAIKNGIGSVKACMWYFNIQIRTWILDLLNKLGIEMILRRLLKKQEIDFSDIYWFKKEQFYDK